MGPIPARAGRTVISLPPTSEHWANPRACGADFGQLLHTQALTSLRPIPARAGRTVDSSSHACLPTANPRAVRGVQAPVSHEANRIRPIPACAGRTKRGRSGSATQGSANPRACGADLVDNLASGSLVLQGQSPTCAGRA